MKPVNTHQSEQKWSKNSFKSDLKLSMFSNFIFLILTSGVSIALLINWDGFLKEIEKTPFLMMFICFPILSLVFLYLSLKEMIGRLVNGKCLLVLDPFPGSIGGQVGGTINTNKAFHAGLKLKVKLKCMYVSAVSNSNSQSSNKNIVWEEVVYCIGQKEKDGAFFDFCFDVPKKLPESSTESDRGSFHCWRVEVKNHQSGVYFKRSYTIPVFKTVKPVSSKIATSSSSLVTEEAIKSDAIRYANLKQQNMNIKTTFYGFKRASIWFGLLIFGLLFSLFYFTTAPLEMRVIFSLIGVVASSISLYLMGKKLSVIVSPTEIIAHRSVLGFPINTHKMPKQSFSYFRREVDKNVNNIYYKLFACEKVGVEFLVAEGLENKAEANAIQKIYESMMKKN